MCIEKNKQQDYIHDNIKDGYEVVKQRENVDKAVFSAYKKRKRHSQMHNHANKRVAKQCIKKLV